MKSIATVVHNRLTGWALGLALAATAGATSAAVLYEQLPDTPGDAFGSYSDAGQTLAEDFTLGSAVNLDGISWWGSLVADEYLGDFQVSLFSDLNDPPLLDLSGVPIIRSVVDVTNDVYQYQLATSQSLAAGTYYLVVMMNNSPGNDTEWHWQGALTGNNQFWVDGSGWVNITDDDLALRLTGQVPEPGSLGLLLAAGAALVVARRRT